MTLWYYLKQHFRSLWGKFPFSVEVFLGRRKQTATIPHFLATAAQAGLKSNDKTSKPPSGAGISPQVTTDLQTSEIRSPTRNGSFKDPRV